jgi:hypothetical protein
VRAENPQVLRTWNLCIYILDWFYVPCHTLSRISIVMLYLRIFTSKKVKYFCWGIITYLTCNGLAFMITANLQCFPLEYVWNQEIDGHCFDIALWWKVSNIPNVLADVAILFLPLQTIWKLHTTLLKKLSICFVCLTGSMYVGTSPKVIGRRSSYLGRGLIASCARTGTFFTALAESPPDQTCELLQTHV